MSSMLKKGTGAFKPRAPIARRRPAPPSATAAAAAQEAPDESVPPESQPTTTSAQEPSSEVPPHVVASSSTNVESRSAQPSPAISTSATAEVSPPEPSAEQAATTGVLSGPPEKQSAPTQDSTHGTAPASTTGTATKPARAGPGRSTAFVKPRPVAETTEPEPPSTRPPVELSAQTGDGATTSITDIAEESTAPAASDSVAPKKAKKAAPKQPRKRKAVTATGESEAEAGAETGAPPKKKRAPRKKAVVSTNGEDGGTQASATENGESTAPKRRQPRKKKAAADHAVSDVEQNGERDGVSPVDDVGEETEGTKKAQARRKRSVTPEDAEQQTVDHEQMVMSELTKDLRIGAKFSKYDELRERMRKKRARQRLIKLGKLQPGDETPDGEDGASEGGTPASEPSKPARGLVPVPIVDEAPSDAGMPRLVMRDGQLTLDEGTTQYDRHAAADAARGVVYEQEEDEFTTAVTQATYMRRQPQGNFWTDEETVKFYHGLRMFGTDFNTISKMFGGAKNRRQVKLKFNREERANPVAVNKCIIGEKVVPMELEAVDGADSLEDSKAITDELDRLKEEQEAETRRQEEDKAAENQRRRDELFGRRKGDKALSRDDDGDGPGKEDDGDNAAKESTLLAYGIGTDPDVIDETDMPAASARGKGRGRGGRGRRGGKAAALFAGGIGS